MKTIVEKQIQKALGDREENARIVAALRTAVRYGDVSIYWS
jgi:hypothetical protein